MKLKLSAIKDMHSAVTLPGFRYSFREKRHICKRVFLKTGFNYAFIALAILQIAFLLHSAWLSDNCPLVILKYQPR